MPQNLTSLIHQLDDLPIHKTAFGEIRVLGGEQVMGFWAKLNAGTHIPAHSHPNERSPGYSKAASTASSAPAKKPAAKPGLSYSSQPVSSTRSGTAKNARS